MTSWRRGNGSEFGHTGSATQQPSDRVPGRRPPRQLRAFVRVHRALVAHWLLLLVGFAVQCIVIGIVWELVDLSISLMEVWAELARKHLEITL